ncbi:heme ABC exporter ATP-binding protein CcmA [Parvularcula sp. IMCC14364]|uniref:heme ABC exporter ATP-binding protein CcmA n=1 Tax=Parvularcula sp. IMCC14364 TaxID=3067902 RepID=UPI002741FB56|nr:heme ABC exporter ATP-binding protein CcmA [Parvularcula sp. IMCC14364]
MFYETGMGTETFQISLQIHDLGVERAGRHILAGVNFSVVPGDALVLRGTNGAGKTSLLRALAGFARVQEGEIRFLDGPDIIHREDIAATHMHYLGHENGVSLKLTVLENIISWSQLLAPRNRHRAADIIAQVGLSLMASERASRLSAGQKRRLALARLLIAPRAVWLMDEPATALDAAGQELLKDVCQQHRAKGGIIVLTAHEGFTLPNAQGLHLAVGIPA